MSTGNCWRFRATIASSLWQGEWYGKAQFILYDQMPAYILLLTGWRLLFILQNPCPFGWHIILKFLLACTCKHYCCTALLPILTIISFIRIYVGIVYVCRKLWTSPFLWQFICLVHTSLYLCYHRYTASMVALCLFSLQNSTAMAMSHTCPY